MDPKQAITVGIGLVLLSAGAGIAVFADMARRHERGTGAAGPPPDALIWAFFAAFLGVIAVPLYLWRSRARVKYLVTGLLAYVGYVGAVYELLRSPFGLAVVGLLACADLLAVGVVTHRYAAPVDGAPASGVLGETLGFGAFAVAGATGLWAAVGPQGAFLWIALWGWLAFWSISGAWAPNTRQLPRVRRVGNVWVATWTLAFCVAAVIIDRARAPAHISLRCGKSRRRCSPSRWCCGRGARSLETGARLHAAKLDYGSALRSRGCTVSAAQLRG